MHPGGWWLNSKQMNLPCPLLLSATRLTPCQALSHKTDPPTTTDNLTIPLRLEFSFLQKEKIMLTYRGRERGREGERREGRGGEKGGRREGGRMEGEGEREGREGREAITKSRKSERGKLVTCCMHGLATVLCGHYFSNAATSISTSRDIAVMEWWLHWRGGYIREMLALERCYIREM